MAHFSFIIISEDKKLIEDFHKILDFFPTFQITGEYSNPMEAIDKLTKEPVDLLIIDNELAVMKGVEFIKSLNTIHPKLIFSSVIPEVATEAFDLGAIDFLLKPVSPDRLMKAMGRFLNIHGPTLVNENMPDENGKYVWVKENKTLHKINLEEIYFLESMKEYVKFHAKGRKIVTKNAIRNYEKILPKNIFIRTHKSYIISQMWVNAFTSSTIDVNGTILPIGRSYSKNVFARLNYQKK